MVIWLLANPIAGRQSIGLAGVTGLKGHTILKALGLQGYNILPFFCLKEERRTLGYSGYK